MHSPLAISNIVVSRSVGGSSGISSSDALDSSSSVSPSSAAKYAAGGDASPPASIAPSGGAIPLLLRVRRARVLLVASLTSALVAGAMLALSRGVTVASVRVADTRALDAALRSASDYNLYAGMGAALLVRPLLAMVASVAPAALLCFATGAVMQDADARPPSAARAWARRIGTFLLYNGLLWLLSSGFHAVNTHARVSSAAASASTAESASSASGSAADGILRAVIAPSAVLLPAAPECTRPSPQRIPAQVAFAFPSAAWMATALPSGPVLTSANSLSIQLNASASGSASVSASAGDGAVPGSAGSLAGLVLRAADDFLRPRSSAANTSLFSVDPSDDQAALRTAIRSAVAAAVATRAHWANVSVADASLQLVDTPLASAIGFQAATLELPLAAGLLRRALQVDANATTTGVEYGDADADGDAEFEINPKEECGRRACVVSVRGAPPTTAAADWGGQVRLLPICETAVGEEDADATMDADGQGCEFTSERAVLVVSFASRMQGDAIATSDADATIVTLTNARKVLQVTVTRLSWTPTACGVSSSSSGDCVGLSFPLTTADGLPIGRVAVDAALLPNTSALASYAPSPLDWTPLALASAQEVDAGGALKSDLVFPRSFADATGFRELRASECEQERGAFLDLVERGHYFSERSLTPAALAGLFWLLQGGSVTSAVTSDGSDSASSAATASDSASIIDIELAVPDAAAALTYAGCAALWLMAVAVFLGGRRREADIERRFKPAHLARALLDNDAAAGDGDAFGGFLGGGSGPFSRRVLHINLLHVGGRFLANSELLDEFELGGVALRHRARPSDVLVVPATQSATASYLSAAGELQQTNGRRHLHRQIDQFQGQVI